MLYIQSFDIPKMTSINFCNFHTMMTYTTPIIHDSSKTKLSDVFYSYEEMSIFGLDCYFRINGKFNKTHYVPSLYALYLEFNNKDIISSNESTLDNSYISFSSDDGFTKGKNFLQFTEDKKHYNRKDLMTKIDEIFSHYDIEDTQFSQISQNSWFSIEWTIGKTTGQSELSCKDSFLMFYKFRNEILTESVKHSPVIGCLMNGNTNYGFWFTNNVNICNVADFNLNKQFYNILNVYIF